MNTAPLSGKVLPLTQKYYMNTKDLEESIISTIKAITAIDKIVVDFDLEEVNFSTINQNSFLANQISLPKIINNN